MFQLRRCHSSMTRRLMGSAALIVALTAPHAIQAQGAVDPAGDFLGTYTGLQNPDLDILTAQAFFNGSQFLFTSTLAGTVGTTAGTAYAWGINRGVGTSPGGVFQPGVKFDALVVFNPAGGSFVLDLLSATNTPLSNVLFAGNTVSGSVALGLLPTQGFDPTAYQVNLWSRNGAGGDETFADFAPDAQNIGVTVTPEPGTSALAFAGLLVMGVVLRRRKRANSGV